MRLLIPIIAPLLIPCCAWGGAITLVFADIAQDNGTDESYHTTALGDYYNGGAGGQLGIYSHPGGYLDAFVVGGTLTFPLHGPNSITVEGGFSGSLTFDYTGYVPYEQYRSIITLKYQGVVVASAVLEPTQPGEYRRLTIAFPGTADTIYFALAPNGAWWGNAGDMEYRSIAFQDVLGYNPPPVISSAPVLSHTRSAPSVLVNRPRVRATPRARVR